MSDTLRRHQTEGAAFLATKPFALLADQAGSGKTATMVRGADLVNAKRVAVFCPATVRPHWAREFSRWQTQARDVHVTEGSPRHALVDGVTIMSHASLVKPETLRLLRENPPDLILADEGGEFRTFDAARTRHLYGPAPYGLWASARHVWHATATPVTNSAGDLFPLWCGPLAGRTPLGHPSWFEFCTRFTDLRQDGLNGMKPVGMKNGDELRRLLGPVTLRRDFDVGVPLATEQVPLDVPESELVAVQAELRGWPTARVEQAMMDGSDRSEAEFSRARRAMGVAMAPRVAAWTDSLLRSGQSPLVVFFHHQDVKNILHAALSRGGWRVAWIDGGVSRKQLVAAEQWFQAGRLDVLLVQIQAGSMGLTFTRSNIAVMAELPWTASAMWQAVKRVHRMGQTRPCWGALMTCKFWLMEIMLGVLARKKTMSQELLDPMTELVA